MRTFLKYFVKFLYPTYASIATQNTDFFLQSHSYQTLVYFSINKYMLPIIGNIYATSQSPSYCVIISVQDYNQFCTIYILSNGNPIKLRLFKMRCIFEDLQLVDKTMISFS